MTHNFQGFKGGCVCWNCGFSILGFFFGRIPACKLQEKKD